MRIPKIYLDTSTISYLKQDDSPDKMKDTLLFWDLARDGKYNIFISDHVLEEIKKCPEPKLSILLDFLSSIEYTIIEKDDDADILATAYINHGILTQKSYDDCLHIALATLYECDVIVSWNFKHMVRYKTITGVRAVNALYGYTKAIDIIHPTVLINESEG